MSKLTRRDTLTATAASGLLLLRPQTVRGYQANSAVTFGIIGTGGRGQYVGGLMADNPRTRLTAICDLYPDRIDQVKTKIPAAASAKTFRSAAELLSQSGVDAVLISTPVYMHPEHFEMAIKAKKHIYCEKPAGADVAGVKRLLKASEAADPTKTIQFGFQQRFSPEYIKARDYVRNGKIGEMKLMISYWVLGGVPPTNANANYKGTPDEKIRNWGRFMETSGGPLIEQDCHGLDTLNWFVNDDHPTSAIGTGGLRYPVPYGDWKTDHHNITYFYPNGVEGYLQSIKHTAGYRDVREQFFGPKGLVETARSYYKLHGPIAGSGYKTADNLEDTSLIEKVDSKRDITAEAVEHFYRSIQDNKPINMTRSSANSTFTALLGRMSIEKRREVTWDELLQSA